MRLHILAPSLTCPGDRRPDWITTSHFPLKQKTNEMSLLHAVLLTGHNQGGAVAFPSFLALHQRNLSYFFLSLIFSQALILLFTP